ncbi:winged helix-turn-helix domain-containing protein [Micromonospora eburnea]
MAELIARLFRLRYTLRGVSLLLHCVGFSPQARKH